MYDNPFDKPRPIETPAPGIISDEWDVESARLSDSDAAFLEREGNAEPILPSDTGPQPLERTLCVLLSVVLNVAVLIALALLLLPSEPEPLSVEAVFSDTLGDQLDVMTLDEGNLNPTEAEEYAVEVVPDVRPDEMNIFEPEEKEFLDDAAAPFYDQSRIDMRELLTGRTDPGVKNDLLAKYGGTKLTSEAVRLGLIWLKKQQGKNGAWSLKGPFRDGIGEAFSDNQEAAGGMALLAFQGDGNTRYFGEYKETVNKGWKWLLTRQNEDGSFFAAGRTPGGTSSSGRFYTQAIVTIALCELIAMERTEGRGAELRAAAQKAVDYLVRWQNRDLGGWKYDEGIGSDLSVTGWVLMALQTARVADLYVPSETLERISVFLDSVAYDDGSQYFYSKELPERRPSMTATGLLCREYLGWDRKNETLLTGAAILTRSENLVRYAPLRESAPSDAFAAPQERSRGKFYTNVYGWYSAAMALKHLGPYNKYWRLWNKAMSAEIPTHQASPDTPEAGSWDPAFDSYRFGGGRLYVTCLSILCLEVYYRHLSLYVQPDSPPPGT